MYEQLPETAPQHHVNRLSRVLRRLAPAGTRARAKGGTVTLNADEARKIGLTYTKIKPAIAQEMKLPTWTTGVTRADVEAAIDMTKDSGFIAKDPDIEALLPQGSGS
jgi:hypothetical protein